MELSEFASFRLVRLRASLGSKNAFREIDLFVKSLKELKSPEKAMTALIRLACDEIPSNKVLDYLVTKLVTINYYVYKRLAEATPGPHIRSILKSLERVFPDVETIIVSDKDDLMQLEKTSYPIYYMYDPVEAVMMGYLPSNEYVKSPSFGRYVQGESWNDIAFWNPSEFHPSYLKTSSPYWILRNEEELITYAEQTANSIPLMFIRPDLIYSSRRPHTSMLSFILDKENFGTVLHTEEPFPYSFKIIPIPSEESLPFETRGMKRLSHPNEAYALPVTRYGEGMSRGLYRENSVGYAGTFYYYEPQSTTYLTFNTVKVAFNKISLADEWDVEYTNTKHLYILREHAKGLLPKDLVMSPSDVTKDDIVGIRPGYAGNRLNLYGEEDSLDQALSIKGSELGYDLIIFTHMVGSYQVVCEILDNRTRRDSFLNLVRV